MSDTIDGAPSDKIDRRAFLARSAALSAAATAGAVLAPPVASGKTKARAAGYPQVEGADVRPEALDDPVEATVAEAATLIRSRKLKITDLVQAHVDRIRAIDGTLLAFNTVVADQALQRAAALERQKPRSALHGIPLCIKDNCYTQGIRTTANSTIYADFVPSFDATVVAKLLDAGSITLGKGQMGPLATTRATLPNGVVTTINAWTPANAAYNPGGSSTGPATSVASRMAKSSIGTQTGGSITGPSNQQGLTGLKPTMGRTSLYGVVPLSYTRDHVGPLARDAMDAAIMLTALAGPDPNDPRTRGLPEPTDYVTAATPVRSGRGWSVRYRTRLGVLPDFLTGGSDQARAARARFLDDLRTVGVEVVEIPLPTDWAALVGTQFNNVRLPERSEAFLDDLRTDVTRFGAALSGWVQGLFLTGDTFLKGQRMKHLLLQRVLGEIFDKVDVVTQSSNQPFDIIGLPEIAFPVGFSTVEPAAAGASVPVGAILGAAPYAEDRLLAVVSAYQKVTDWHTRRPPEPAHATVARTARARAAQVADRPQLTPEEVLATMQ